MKRKLLRHNHSSYISKPLRKAIMIRSYLEKVYYKNNRKKALKHIRKRKTFVSDRIKKKGNGVSTKKKGNALLLLTMNFSGKRLNHSFQTR